MFPIRSVLFSLEERICHTDQRNHADIRAVQILLTEDIVRNIYHVTLKLLAQPQSVDTEVNGEHQARHILENILCARFVRGTGNTFKLRWLTISNRTEVIINCFGIKATGRAFVRAVMIKKRDGLTVNLHTVTEIVPIFICRTNRCVFLFFAV